MKHAEAYRDMETQILDLDTLIDIIVSSRNENAGNKEDRLDFLITLLSKMWIDFADPYRLTVGDAGDAS